MNPNTLIALAYLFAELTNAGLNIRSIDAAIDAKGDLPPEEKERLKAALKTAFADAKEFWGS